MAMTLGAKVPCSTQSYTSAWLEQTTDLLRNRRRRKRPSSSHVYEAPVAAAMYDADINIQGSKINKSQYGNGDGNGKSERLADGMCSRKSLPVLFLMCSFRGHQ